MGTMGDTKYDSKAHNLSSLVIFGSITFSSVIYASNRFILEYDY